MSDKLKQSIAAGLLDKSAKTGRDRAFGVIRPGMKRMTARYPELSAKLRGIKEYSINHIDELLALTVKNMQANGCKVFVAETPQEALEYIGALVKQGLVVKSKTNAGKEIDLPTFLTNQGATVIETDLGDRINQLDGGAASHSLAPAIHVPIERVAQLFSADMGLDLEPELDQLVQAARHNLRRYLEDADIGISGANAVAADTGSIVVTENEGNIRAVTSMPKLHIAVAGIEKIVPTLHDAITIVKSAAVFGVGQDIGTYISVISGTSRHTNPAYSFLGNADGPREVHMVFLKNGRQKAIDDGYAEALYCINCGSCLNFCPVYGAIGEKFGYKYLGGRGTIFTAMHADAVKAENAGLSLCIGCKRCEGACAVGMHAPRMIAELRAEQAAAGALNTVQRSVFGNLAANRLSFFTKLARKFQGLGIRSTGKGQGKLRFSIDSLGIPADRLIPQLADKSLPELLAHRQIVQSGSRVALFAGCVINYIRPDLGQKLIGLLDGQNITTVTFANEACCGIPAITSGDIQSARKMAADNVRLLAKEDYDYLLFLCPTCATTARDEWTRLLADDPELSKETNRIAKKITDVSDFLCNILQLKPPTVSLDTTVTYHDSCHLARGLKLTNEPRNLLKAIDGVKLVEMADPDACCGFGGSFSVYYYELARSINEEKIKDILQTGADTVITGCPGCMIHIADGIDHAGSHQKVLHLIELLAQVYPTARQ